MDHQTGISADHSNDPAQFVTRRTLKGGLHGGMEIIEVDNGRMKFWLLPERGMSIWKVWLDGIEIGWHSPVRGPVHPQHVPLHEESGLGWLAGFDELLCRCGLESNGAPEFDATGKLKYPLHGRIANLPAQDVTTKVEGDEIRIEGQVDEARFKSQKLALCASVSTRHGSAEIVIRDRVSNPSALPAEFQLLYHINFGPPLLEAGAQVLAPVKTLVPRTHHAAKDALIWSKYAAPQAGFEEQVYFMALSGDETGATQVLLKNAAGTMGVSIHFYLTQLPCFTLWKDTAAMQDGYVTGLEPGTNYPNPRSFERDQGRIERLLPGQTREFELRLEFHLDAVSIRLAEQNIARLQASRSPQVHDTVQSGWSINAA
ncbi:MAG: aldose 1-epimerase family protein [Nitrosomonadales bacterium]